MSQSERVSEKNGVWMCQVHGKYIDDNLSKCSVEEIRRWKQEHEQWVLDQVEKGTSLFERPDYASFPVVNTPIAVKPIYIYLQRPDSGDWVTVGRYLLPAGSSDGMFKYAPSYVDAGHYWSIDPINLPFCADYELAAQRYHGLHDVLRDTCPDAWGQGLLRLQHELPEQTSLLRYLVLAGNVERWGALAVGVVKKPLIAGYSSLKLSQLPLLVEELNAINERRSTVDSRLRKRVMQAAAVGGARPKGTVQDEHGAHWLVKPQIATDLVDIPRIEHMAQQWGAASGLDFAETVFHCAVAGRSVVRVLRFDREHDRRRMCVSAASLLQTEYPGDSAHAVRWSYPRLAEELRMIGAPAEDGIELFGRMIFNAVCGNDDDHVRNHAVVYRHDQKRWRLAPAFDVVPNPVETPRTLMLQLSMGRFDISRAAALADARRFGFASKEEAERYLDDLLIRVRKGFDTTAHWLDPEWQQLLLARLQENIKALGR